MNSAETPRYYLCRDFNGKTEILHGDYPGLGWQTIHPGTEDLEESKQKWNLQEKPCIECGELFSINYCEPYRTILKRDNICFGCNFWRDICNKHCGDPNQVIVKGVHYLICKESTEGNKRWDGFGGALFKIKFHDGRAAKSTNLWCQGRIPSRFLEKLPDNAVFET